MSEQTRDTGVLNVFRYDSNKNERRLLLLHTPKIVIPLAKDSVKISLTRLL